MILCITPNPALDRTLAVSHFGLGKVFRAESSLAVAGGKGVNVARASHILGAEATCAGFIGGNIGRIIAESAEREGLKSSWTWIDGETRTCTIIADPAAGEATVINEQGPSVTESDWERLHTHVIRAASLVDCICFSGSLPPGSPVPAFVKLVEKVKTLKKPIWVDTSGASLKAVQPLKGIAIKINGDELGAILGETISDAAAAAAAANQLRQSGTEIVVVTLGASGAVMAHPNGSWWAYPPGIKTLSAVGSGDSFLAGMVVALEQGLEPEVALTYAVAAGAANALSIGGGQFPMSDFKQILAQTTLQPI